MDDASSLISNLLRKLRELDNNVSAYRTDTAADFQRYSDMLLQDVPESVTSEVNRAIAASMSRFPSLYPGSGSEGRGEGREEPESPSIDRRLWDGRGSSPPPILHHTSGTPSNPISGSGNKAARSPASSPSESASAAASGSAPASASTSASMSASPRLVSVSPSKDKCRDPHAREREFHGVFTPSYLPLLDSSDRPVHSLPTPPKPASASASSDTTRSSSSQEKATATATDASAPAKTDISGGDRVPKFPPARRFTDPAADPSCSSDKGRVRRSALRRSSSSSNRESPESTKGSPSARRVRFRFEGEEILPTASPQASAKFAALPTAINTSVTLTPAPATTAATPNTVLVYDSHKPTLSLLDADDGDDGDADSPPVKKVSSSQALRALSKLPLEDPSTWTVVDPNADTAEPLEPTKPQIHTPPPSLATNMSVKIPSPPDIDEFEGQSMSSAQGILGSPLQDLEEYDDDASASEDDYISMSMRPTKKKASSPSIRSPVPCSMPTSATEDADSLATNSEVNIPHEGAIAVTKKMEEPPPPPTATATATSMSASTSTSTPTPTPTSTATRMETGKVNGRSGSKSPQSTETIKVFPTKPDDDDDDEGDLFDFDDDNPEMKPKAADAKPRPYLEEEDSEPEIEEEETDRSKKESRTIESMHSESATRTIESAASSHSPSKQTQPPPTEHPLAISIGSYKGRPLTFEVVKNPLVLQKAAELGDFHSFVGSVDGRSGVDSSRGDPAPGSLRFSGTPRSFSERMMLDEVKELSGEETDSAAGRQT